MKPHARIACVQCRNGCVGATTRFYDSTPDSKTVLDAWFVAVLQCLF